MGAALKGLGTFMPGIVINSEDRQVLSSIFKYELGHAVILMDEAMAALKAKRWNIASAKAGTLYLLSGKYSMKFGGRETAMKLFMVADYIRTMAVERKKAAARMKKASALTGLAFKLANLKTYTAAISR